MDKKRLFRIMAKADKEDIASLARELKEKYSIIVIKEPEKMLTMVKMRDPVRRSLFYIGEVMVSEAIVEIDGTKGIAVVMGDDFDKTLDMAIIDAACNKDIFDGERMLLELEKAQMDLEMKENAMHMKTMVSFDSMD